MPAEEHPESIRAFFEGLEGRLEPAQTQGKHVSYRFDVREVGRWRVELDDGTIRVEESDAEADCAVEADEATFLGIVRREKSPALAYMTGKIKVRGDVGKLAELQEILP